MPIRLRVVTSLTIAATIGRAPPAATTQEPASAQRGPLPAATPAGPFDLDAMMARMATVPERRTLLREESV
jgi:hypothetical protein